MAEVLETQAVLDQLQQQALEELEAAVEDLLEKPLEHKMELQTPEAVEAVKDILMVQVEVQKEVEDQELLLLKLQQLIIQALLQDLQQ